MQQSKPPKLTLQLSMLLIHFDTYPNMPKPIHTLNTPMFCQLAILLQLRFQLT